jgi:hypothetical protein
MYLRFEFFQDKDLWVLSCCSRFTIGLMSAETSLNSLKRQEVFLLSRLSWTTLRHTQPPPRKGSRRVVNRPFIALHFRYKEGATLYIQSRICGRGLYGDRTTFAFKCVSVMKKWDEKLSKTKKWFKRSIKRNLGMKAKKKKRGGRYFLRNDKNYQIVRKINRILYFVNRASWRNSG